MKKFVMYRSIGDWGIKNGHEVIDCMVKGRELVAEFDNEQAAYDALAAIEAEHRVIEYKPDGHWYHYSVTTRAKYKRGCM